MNFSTLGGRIIAFNYRSMFMDEDTRLDIHKRFIMDHYLRQFNEETIDQKQQRTCGEPCSAVCKKMRDEYKKDYEPYQTMGPLCGIFDQRAAEKLNHHADSYGFDAISAGGVLAWFMDCLDAGDLTPDELGVSGTPVFTHENFDLKGDSMINAELGMELLDGILEQRGLVNLQEGARKLARRLSRTRGSSILNRLVYTAFARKGWMVPNQYWTPGVLSPMPIMGKYYNFYGNDFLNPRELGRINAERFRQELIMDNLGICRFHRGWAEEMLPDIIASLFGQKDRFLESIAVTASRINSRNASVYWESERNIDFVQHFIQRKYDVEGIRDPEMIQWLDAFKRDRCEAALSFWYEIHKGIHESLREF